MEIEQREDRPAYVRFERLAIEDPVASREEGRSILKDVDFIYVKNPGSKDEFPAKAERFLESKILEVQRGRLQESHLRYWKECYKRFLEGQDMPLEGSPIKEWAALSPAKIANLVNMGVHTIEDLASANDQVLKRIGMGAVELRKKANNWLNSGKDIGKVTEKITALEVQNEALQKTNDDLIERMNLLMKKLEKGSNEPEDSVKIEEISAEDILDVQVSSNPADSIITPSKQYEEVFGRKPNPLWKEATVLAKVKAKRKL